MIMKQNHNMVKKIKQCFHDLKADIVLSWLKKIRQTSIKYDNKFNHHIIKIILFIFLTNILNIQH